MNVPTPIHNAIPDETTSALVDFLEYLSSNGYHICKWHNGLDHERGAAVSPPGYYPEHHNMAQWIVESLGHSYDAWVAEKDAVLAAIREGNKK